MMWDSQSVKCRKCRQWGPDGHVPYCRLVVGLAGWGEVTFQRVDRRTHAGGWLHSKVWTDAHMNATGFQAVSGTYEAISNQSENCHDPQRNQLASLH